MIGSFAKRLPNLKWLVSHLCYFQTFI
jgi:hypothetical protein